MCFTFVVSNFTIMRDYKKHLTLLPHKWQVVGFVMLATIAICFVPFYFLQQQYSHELWPIYLYLAGDFVLSAALLMLCLSQEKVEDEYIMSVRLVSRIDNSSHHILHCKCAKRNGVWAFAALHD